MVDIHRYIQQSTRNKIIISKLEVPEIAYLDIGLEISRKLVPILDSARFVQKAYDLILETFQQGVHSSKYDKNTFALKNIGILLEPTLKLNLNQLFDEISKNTSLFILSEGTYENGILYFLSKAKGKQINFKNISHITI
tara:strand:+ start:238 stop:654 length:417 start_codon:yes stop_codon:yes gene_type:complete